MAADDNHFIRQLAAAQFCNRIATRRVGQHLRTHHQLHTYVLSTRLHAIEHFCILDTERCGRNFRDRRVVA